MRRLIKIALVAQAFAVPGVAIAQRFEASAAAFLARGNSSTGVGVGVAIDSRWRAPRREWLVLAVSVAATSLGTVALPAEASLLRANGSALGVSVGPELSYRFRHICPYVRALGGATLVQTSSTLTSFGETYDFGSVSALAAYAEFGGGIAVPVAARFSIDVGVRRALSSPTAWARNPQGSFVRSAPLPDIVYRRSLAASLWYAGVRFAPKRS